MRATTSCLKAAWIIREWRSRSAMGTSLSKTLMATPLWRADYAETYMKSIAPLHHRCRHPVSHLPPTLLLTSTFGMHISDTSASRVYDTLTATTLWMAWTSEAKANSRHVMAVPRESTTKPHSHPCQPTRPPKSSNVFTWTYRAHSTHQPKGSAISSL